MGLGDVIDELHDEHRLTNTRSTKQADLTTPLRKDRMSLLLGLTGDLQVDRVSQIRGAVTLLPTEHSERT